MAIEDRRPSWALCETCGAFETRSTDEQAQRWLDLHAAFEHTQPSCHHASCAQHGRHWPLNTVSV